MGRKDKQLAAGTLIVQASNASRRVETLLRFTVFGRREKAQTETRAEWARRSKICGGCFV